MVMFVLAYPGEPTFKFLHSHPLLTEERAFRKAASAIFHSSLLLVLGMSPCPFFRIFNPAFNCWPQWTLPICRRDSGFQFRLLLD